MTVLPAHDRPTVCRARSVTDLPCGKEQVEMEYTAIVKRSGEWWIGWIEEVPGVNCQERTHAELRKSLTEALTEALEFNRREARAAAGDNYREEKVAVA